MKKPKTILELFEKIKSDAELSSSNQAREIGKIAYQYIPSLVTRLMMRKPQED